MAAVERLYERVKRRGVAKRLSRRGLPSLMVSLWNIDEKVSAGIVAGYYEDLPDGMPKHKA